ncbi:MAG TPA: hypothetical protein VGK63_05085 [Candidatus Limnocylindrales bacterium]
MSLVNVVLWVIGVVLVGLGWQRAREPWRRLQDLRAQDENAARYNAWRGGVRNAEGPTGASVMMEMLRRRMQTGFLIAITGIALVVAGFAVK